MGAARSSPASERFLLGKWVPGHYRCNTCHEVLTLPFQWACYYTGSAPAGGKISDTDLLPVPVRPAWCGDCQSLTLAEDIAALGVFEGAYAYVRSGRSVEYPIDIGKNMAPVEAQSIMEAYLRWRMERRHEARALCCGGHDFQYTDVDAPLIRHADCESGFFWQYSTFRIASGFRYQPENNNIRTYNTEGELIARLTEFNEDTRGWNIEPAAYPPLPPDEPDFIYGQST